MADLNWESWVEKLIRQAQEEGRFDHLEGQGKPLNLGPDDPDPAQALVNKLLHDQGFVPAWLELEQHIGTEIKAARTAILRSYHWCQAAWAQPGADRERVKDEWERALADFGRKIEEINGLILNHNLELPPALAHRQRPRLQLRDELRRLGIPAL